MNAKAATKKAAGAGKSAGKPGEKSLAARLSNEKLMSVLIGPHLSEKGSRISEQLKQFVFRVRTDADKATVKRAVELMFEVKVAAVQVVNAVGKEKRFGQRIGRRGDFKKAYVRLAPGQTIDYEARPSGA